MESLENLVLVPSWLCYEYVYLCCAFSNFHSIFLGFHLQKWDSIDLS